MMRKLFIVYGILLISFSGCAKNNPPSVFEPLPDRGLFVNTVEHKYSQTAIDSKACARFDLGTRPLKIMAVGGQGSTNVVHVYSLSLPQNSAVTSKEQSGLLLYFVHGKPLFLNVPDDNGNGPPSQEAIVRVMNQIEQMIANATKIDVTCTPATRYVTSGGPYSVNFISLSATPPTENQESDIDAVVTIDGVEP